MRFWLIFIALILIGMWCGLSGILLGYIDLSLANLKLPKNTAEYGDSLGILNGLFSAVAIFLALIAVLLQGKELKASTRAQNEQAEALLKQIIYQKELNDRNLEISSTMLQQLRQQQIKNQIHILQAKQQYHSSEIDRMDKVLEKISGNREKADLFESCVAKKKEHIHELNNIKKEMSNL